MPILLNRVLAFFPMLCFYVATVPSNIGSLPQSTISALPSLELSGNLTLPSFPASRPFRNITNKSLPPVYTIPHTNPLIILQINPSRQSPLDYNKLSYLIVNGLDSFVQETIQLRGDSPIPRDGTILNSANVVIEAKSYGHGTRDLTYGIMARLLRGIWEIAVLFGPCELDMGVYIGGEDAIHRRGYLALYLIAASKETA